MSYNTRRTGGAGRGQTTQVNYHQQSRPGATTTQQSRNPGYTTTSTNYNSASQPVYSTQQPASYNTTPPQPQVQQAQAPAAPPTQPPPPSTPAPILKQEPVTPAQTPTKTETPAPENGTGTGTGKQPNRPVWKTTPFTKLSNRVRKARKNAKLRRALNPKNAITFLNELRPGDVKFTVREEAGWGFIASVDIDGKIYNGHALSVSKAKAQASEVALKDILMEQMAKSAAAAAAAAETKQEPEEQMDTEEKEGEGEEPKPKKRKTEEEDDLPWGSLASFALHKLFEHWQKEGGPGGDGPMPPSQFKYEEEMTDDESYYRKPGPEFGYPRRPPPGAPMFTRGRGFGPYPPRGFMGPRRLPPPPASTFLGNSRQPINIGNAPFPNNALPMKKIPEDANKRNPVMLLNQLKPNVVYEEFQEGTAPNVVFRITVNLDGQEYVGRGKSKKNAKRMAAKAALAPLGVVYEDD